MRSWKGSSRFVLWEGRSLLNGAFIRASIKLGGNAKTRSLPEIWVTPVIPGISGHVAGGTLWDAIKASQEAVCGLCPYAKGRGCYVDPRGILSHTKALHGVSSNGHPPRPSPKLSRAEKLELAELLGPVRFGAWGDVAAVPFEELAMFQVGTGYTHQWTSEYSPSGEPCDPRWREFLMASTGGIEEGDRAISEGWRTFSIVELQVGLLRRDDYILCPASDEAGKRTTCDRCRLCDGRGGKSRKSVFIPAHGKDAGKVVQQ